MKNIPLKPLVPDPDRAVPGFAVCDIESRNWVEFLMIGLYYKLYDKEDNLVRESYQKFENLSDFVEACFHSSQPHETIFAHFGGKFDFNFIIGELFRRRDEYRMHDMLPRGSGLLCMKVSKISRVSQVKKDQETFGQDENGLWIIADRTITFRDSSAMLPFGLGSLTENFNVVHKKKDWDHSETQELTQELEEYAEWDHKGLYEVIEAYFRWPIIKGVGAQYTVASQALRVFRGFMKEPIFSLSKDKDLFIRQSYFGGRTEIFKPFFEQSHDTELLRSYDVNSLYPAVMREFELPNRFDRETDRYFDDRMGFYDVEIYIPEMYIPPLGMRYEGMEDRLIFPTGHLRGIWTTEEINYAVSLGGKILKVHKGMIFKSGGKLFKDYIETLYDIRKKSDKNSVDNVLCKLLMNSTYGRMGLNLERETLIFDDGQSGVKRHIEIPDPKDPRKIISLVTKEITLESSFTNVAIASWVTSCARIWMHKLIQESPHSMYYMDTDSLKTTHTYPRNDDDLGKLKLEYKSKRAAFLLPKTYMEDTLSPIFKIFDDAGREVKGEKTNKKLVMKGFDKTKIQNFKFEDFTSALEGDMRRMKSLNPKKFATLKTALRKKQFTALLEEAPRQIKTRYNKRRVYKRNYAQVYDTEALHIKNGEIVNLDKDVLKKYKPIEESEMIAMADELIKQMMEIRERVADKNI